MKLSTKLIVSFLLVGLIPATVIATIMLLTAAGDLKDEKKVTFGTLSAVRDNKKAQLEAYFEQSEADLIKLEEVVKDARRNGLTKLAAVQQQRKHELETFFNSCINDINILAKSTDMSTLVTEVQEYQGGEDDTSIDIGAPTYRKFVRRWQERLEDWCTDDGKGYLDLTVFSITHSDLLFSLTQDEHLGKSVTSRELKNSGLRRVFDKVQARKAVVLEDYEPYAPAGGRQVGFVGAPVKNEEGRVEAVVVLQLDHTPVQEIVSGRLGMGKSGESYLVSRDDSCGSISFRSTMYTMGDGEYVVGKDLEEKWPAYTRQAFLQKRVQGLFFDSTGMPVQVEAALLDIPDLKWALVTKLDAMEVISPKHKGQAEDFLTRWQKRSGYYDLFLISSDGFVFYTVEQEEDYHTNLLSGPYRSSNLGRLVNGIKQTKRFGFADFEPYAPSDNLPCAFMGMPAMNDGEVEMIIAIQMPIAPINEIMELRSGLGETGESYLVGTDLRMRSNSYLDKEGRSVEASFAGTVEDNGCDTEPVRKCLGGEKAP
jgi:methyl-accepting chemotaxis protein